MCGVGEPRNNSRVLNRLYVESPVEVGFVDCFGMEISTVRLAGVVVGVVVACMMG